MKYRLIDHTADFGIHVFGSDPGDLFKNAAGALFDQLTDVNVLKGNNEKRLTITGGDWPDLMVNWLRELLYLWTGRDMLVKRVAIHEITADRLSATVLYDFFERERHVIKEEIKAVTYHQIQVTEGPGGWEAKIIFDV